MNRRPTWFALFLMTTVLSCVSSSIRPNATHPDAAPEVQKEIPKELSKELHQKFDVKELAAAKPPEIPIPLPSHKRRSKTRAPAAIPPAVPPTFAYPMRRPSVESIWVGEKLTYSISYLGLTAGQVVVEVLPFKTMNGRKVFHIHCHATSSAVFSLVYRLNDTVESFYDYEGNFSHRFHLVLDEKKQYRDSLELYDSEKKETFYWSRWEYPDHSKREVKETAEIQPFSQDSLTGLFYIRTVPLDPNSVVTFPVVSEGKPWDAVSTVLRREMVDSPLGHISAVVLRPEMKYQGRLSKNGDSFLWVSDDARKFPLRLEAKVRIGYVIAQLTKIEMGSAPDRTSAFAEVHPANPVLTPVQH